MITKQKLYVYAEDMKDAMQAVDYWKDSIEEAKIFAFRSDTLEYTKLYEITIEIKEK